MPMTVILISGPARSGKTALASLIAERVCLPNPVKSIRLRRCPGSREVRVRPTQQGGCGREVESYQVDYCPERVFEMLPEALKTVRDRQRICTILLESDPDPAIRFAYTYDVRVFVLAPPARPGELFRSSFEAAEALKEVMEDTAAFASEVFGLFEHGLLGVDDAAAKALLRDGGHPAHPVVSTGQVKRFLATPLGVEIATRIQLQPPYHGLAESDLILVNTGVGATSLDSDKALRNLEMLLARISNGAGRSRPLFRCDLLDQRDPSLPTLLDRLSSLTNRPPPAPLY